MTSCSFTLGDQIAVLLPSVGAHLDGEVPAPRWMAGRLDRIDTAPSGGIELTALDGTGVRLWVPWGFALLRSLTPQERADADEMTARLP